VASKKETLDFVLSQMEGIQDIRTRKMMGEYLIYYREKVVAGIYDDRFLVKLTPSSKTLLPDAPEEQPYEGAKPMLSLSDIVFNGHTDENRHLLSKLFEAIYWEIK
jgi:TfoX/Sxy family transcriptional regulator of competence genes